MTGVGNAAPARSAFSAFQRTTASVAQPSMMVLIALGMACFGHRAIGVIIEAQTGKETRMPGKKSPAKVALRKRPSTTGKIRDVFSAEERAAMKDRVQETKAAARRGDRAADESAVLAKIAQMQEADRAKAERLHAIIMASAPSLAPKLWYGMPAYAKDDKVVCFFQSSQKFKTRYATIGFSDKAKLDDGKMWPTAFALVELSAAEEARISALVQKAIRGTKA